MGLHPEPGSTSLDTGEETMDASGPLSSRNSPTHLIEQKRQISADLTPMNDDSSPKFNVDAPCFVPTGFSAFSTSKSSSGGGDKDKDKGDADKNASTLSAAAPIFVPPQAQPSSLPKTDAEWRAALSLSRNQKDSYWEAQAEVNGTLFAKVFPITPGSGRENAPWTEATEWLKREATRAAALNSISAVAPPGSKSGHESSKEKRAGKAGVPRDKERTPNGAMPGPPHQPQHGDAPRPLLPTPGAPPPPLSFPPSDSSPMSFDGSPMSAVGIHGVPSPPPGPAPGTGAFHIGPAPSPVLRPAGPPPPHRGYGFDGPPDGSPMSARSGGGVPPPINPFLFSSSRGPPGAPPPGPRGYPGAGGPREPPMPKGALRPRPYPPPSSQHPPPGSSPYSSPPQWPGPGVPPPGMQLPRPPNPFGPPGAQGPGASPPNMMASAEALDAKILSLEQSLQSMGWSNVGAREKLESLKEIRDRMMAGRGGGGRPPPVSSSPAGRGQQGEAVVALCKRICGPELPIEWDAKLPGWRAHGVFSAGDFSKCFFVPDQGSEEDIRTAFEEAVAHRVAAQVQWGDSEPPGSLQENPFSSFKREDRKVVQGRVRECKGGPSNLGIIQWTNSGAWRAVTPTAHIRTEEEKNRQFARGSVFVAFPHSVSEIAPLHAKLVRWLKEQSEKSDGPGKRPHQQQQTSQKGASLVSGKSTSGSKTAPHSPPATHQHPHSPSRTPDEPPTAAETPIPTPAEAFDRDGSVLPFLWSDSAKEKEHETQIVEALTHFPDGNVLLEDGMLRRYPNRVSWRVQQTQKQKREEGTDGEGDESGGKEGEKEKDTRDAAAAVAEDEKGERTDSTFFNFEATRSDMESLYSGCFKHPTMVLNTLGVVMRRPSPPASSSSDSEEEGRKKGGEEKGEKDEKAKAKAPTNESSAGAPGNFCSLWGLTPPKEGDSQGGLRRLIREVTALIRKCKCRLLVGVRLYDVSSQLEGNDEHTGKTGDGKSGGKEGGKTEKEKEKKKRTKKKWAPFALLETDESLSLLLRPAIARTDVPDGMEALLRELAGAGQRLAKGLPAAPPDLLMRDPVWEAVGEEAKRAAAQSVLDGLREGMLPPAVRKSVPSSSSPPRPPSSSPGKKKQKEDTDNEKDKEKGERESSGDGAPPGDPCALPACARRFLSVKEEEEEGKERKEEASEGRAEEKEKEKDEEAKPGGGGGNSKPEATPEEEKEKEGGEGEKDKKETAEGGERNPTENEDGGSGEREGENSKIESAVQETGDSSSSSAVSQTKEQENDKGDEEEKEKEEKENEGQSIHDVFVRVPPVPSSGENVRVDNGWINLSVGMDELADYSAAMPFQLSPGYLLRSIVRPLGPSEYLSLWAVTPAGDLAKRNALKHNAQVLGPLLHQQKAMMLAGVKRAAPPGPSPPGPKSLFCSHVEAILCWRTGSRRLTHVHWDETEALTRAVQEAIQVAQLDPSERYKKTIPLIPPEGPLRGPPPPGALIPGAVEPSHAAAGAPAGPPTIPAPPPPPLINGRPSEFDVSYASHVAETQQLVADLPLPYGNLQKPLGVIRSRRDGRWVSLWLGFDPPPQSTATANCVDAVRYLSLLCKKKGYFCVAMLSQESETFTARVCVFNPHHPENADETIISPARETDRLNAVHVAVSATIRTIRKREHAWRDQRPQGLQHPLLNPPHSYHQTLPVGAGAPPDFFPGGRAPPPPPGAYPGPGPGAGSPLPMPPPHPHSAAAAAAARERERERDADFPVTETFRVKGGNVDVCKCCLNMNINGIEEAMHRRIEVNDILVCPPPLPMPAVGFVGMTSPEDFMSLWAGGGSHELRHCTRALALKLGKIAAVGGWEWSMTPVCVVYGRRIQGKHQCALAVRVDEHPPVLIECEHRDAVHAMMLAVQKANVQLDCLGGGLSRSPRGAGAVEGMPLQSPLQSLVPQPPPSPSDRDRPNRMRAAANLKITEEELKEGGARRREALSRPPIIGFDDLLGWDSEKERDMERDGERAGCFVPSTSPMPPSRRGADGGNHLLQNLIDEDRGGMGGADSPVPLPDDRQLRANDPDFACLSQEMLQLLERVDNSGGEREHQDDHQEGGVADFQHEMAWAAGAPKNEDALVSSSAFFGGGGGFGAAFGEIKRGGGREGGGGSSVSPPTGGGGDAAGGLNQQSAFILPAQDELGDVDAKVWSSFFVPTFEKSSSSNSVNKADNSEQQPGKERGLGAFSFSNGGESNGVLRKTPGRSRSCNSSRNVQPLAGESADSTAADAFVGGGRFSAAVAGSPMFPLEGNSLVLPPDLEDTSAFFRLAGVPTGAVGGLEEEEGGGLEDEEGGGGVPLSNHLSLWSPGKGGGGDPGGISLPRLWGVPGLSSGSLEAAEGEEGGGASGPSTPPPPLPSLEVGGEGGEPAGETERAKEAPPSQLAQENTHSE